MSPEMNSLMAALVLRAMIGATLPVYESTHFGVDLDLDAYYTALAGYVGIGEARPDFGEANEAEIYTYLWSNLFKPHAFLFEASTYPMPLLGVGMKANTQDFYGRADLDKDVEKENNLIQALTAGFEEPYAFSGFFGNMAQFKVPGSDIQGISYAGFLASFGLEHIKNNTLIATRWYEFEAKLKGDDIKEYRKLKWSYRAGARLFQHDDITSYWYISTLRDRIDYTKTGFDLLRNSFLEASLWIKAKPDISSSDVIRILLVGGKNFPFWDNKLTFSMGLGVLISGSDKYRGCLQQDTQDLKNAISECETLADPKDYFSRHESRKAKTVLQPVIRPNLKF